MKECSTLLWYVCVCWYVTRLEIKIFAYDADVTRKLHDNQKTDGWSTIRNTLFREIFENIRKLNRAKKGLESVSKIVGCNLKRSDRYVKYLYTADPWKSRRESKDSTGSNLKFDNALLRVHTYSPGSRELCCESTDAARITSCCRCASVCGLVCFSAIIQRHNFVAVPASVIASYRNLSHLASIQVFIFVSRLCPSRYEKENFNATQRYLSTYLFPSV